MTVRKYFIFILLLQTDGPLVLCKYIFWLQEKPRNIFAWWKYSFEVQSHKFLINNAKSAPREDISQVLKPKSVVSQTASKRL